MRIDERPIFGTDPTEASVWPGKRETLNGRAR